MDAETVMQAVRGRELDRDFIGQSDLDVEVRDRRSALPWRGQFTPGLVAKLIDAYYPGSGLVVDPFLGSGTTILESIRKGVPSAGSEINPAALELSGILELSSRSKEERRKLVAEAGSYLDKLVPLSGETLFGDTERVVNEPTEYVLEGLRKAEGTDLARILATTLLLGMGDKKEADSKRILKAWIQVRGLIRDFPDAAVESRVIAADARSVPLSDHCAGLIVTSPPYVNVFNYHQNYRPAVESIGWNVLPAARTEIGSNRKNRQNRFLTVIQYCIDMMQALTEMGRLISRNGRVVLVVGRESKVRGVRFSNSEIIACLAEAVPSIQFKRWQERKFVNRFGVTIYEDILSFDATGCATGPSADELIEYSRKIAHWVLSEACEGAVEDVQDDVRLALEATATVIPSPELELAKV